MEFTLSMGVHYSLWYEPQSVVCTLMLVVLTAITL